MKDFVFVVNTGYSSKWLIFGDRQTNGSGHFFLEIPAPPRTIPPPFLHGVGHFPYHHHAPIYINRSTVSVSFLKIPRLIGRLWSGPYVVGRLVPVFSCGRSLYIDWRMVVVVVGGGDVLHHAKTKKGVNCPGGANVRREYVRGGMSRGKMSYIPYKQPNLLHNLHNYCTEGQNQRIKSLFCGRGLKWKY